MDTRHYDHKRAAKRSYTGLVVGGIIVAAALIALVYYFGMGERSRSAANPPAVITYPAPATRTPAPAETTTGQTIPRPSGQ
jgi:hypothetical protein